MNFFDGMKIKYQFGLSKEPPVSNELLKLIAHNPLPADHIIKNEEVLNIYTNDVSLSDIVNFFQERMSFIELEFDQNALELNTPAEIMNAKSVIYSSFVEMLEMISELWNGKSSLGPTKKNLKVPKYVTNGNTIH